MPELEFDLDGTPFGGSHPVQIADIVLDAAEVLTGDVVTRSRSGVTVGRDAAGGAPWTFTLFATASDEAAGRTAMASLADAWAAAKTMSAGQLQMLRYTTAGRTRLVYGRARRWMPPSIDRLAAVGSPTVIADFLQADPLFYAAEEYHQQLSIVPATTGGLIAPLIGPLSTARSGTPESRYVTVAGGAPTPVRVAFTGPVARPWARIGTTTIALTGSLAHDQTVTVDARTRTVMRTGSAEGSAAGLLDPRARLAELLLPPGRHEVQFGGTDLTGTATCTVSWRDAWTSP